MKKIVCVLLSGMMLFSCFSFNAGAETGPPSGQVPGIGEQWDKDLTIRFAVGDTFPYTGKPVMPKFIVSDSTGRILVEGTDYCVEYWNNTDPGTAMAYIIPIGDASSGYIGTGYSVLAFHISGEKPDTFEMPDFGSFKLPAVEEMEVPDWVGTNGKLPDLGTSSKKTKLPKAVVTSITTPGKGKVRVGWKKCAKISGYQIQYSTNKSFRKNVKSKTVGRKKTSVAISKLKKATYYVRIRAYKKAKGKTRYGKWSGVKKIKLKK